jgi:hypothetical protein
MKNIIPTVIGLSLILIGLIFAFIFSSTIVAKILDKKGMALFDNDNIRLVFDEKTVCIVYDDIIKLKYKKIIGSHDGWSFLPKGELIITTSDKQICINGSIKETWEKKIAHGIWKPSKISNQPDVSLWNILVELHIRTQLPIMVEEIIEKS